MNHLRRSILFLFLFCFLVCGELVAQRPQSPRPSPQKARKAQTLTQAPSQVVGRQVLSTQKVLRVAPGEVVLFPDASYDFDTLAMGFRSQIKLQAGLTTVVVDRVFISGRATIDGKGPDGAKGLRGNPGRNGNPSLKKKASDGDTTLLKRRMTPKHEYLSR